jgi:hypothetical protein
MNFVLPDNYGNTQQTYQELTGKQQLVGQGISTAGDVLMSLFTRGTTLAPSSGGAYYEPLPDPPPSNTPIIISSVLIGTLIIGGIVWYNKAKK